MNVLQDIITYVRRIIKTPSDAVIKDSLIIDYINRFWLMDMSARVQLFDLKTKYQFQTTPGIDQYNMPLYSVQTETTNPSQTIQCFPVYQGFMSPALVNGVTVPFYTQRSSFVNAWPSIVQSLPNIAIGDGTSTYTLNIPFFPLIPGHIDMAGIIASGNAPTDPITGTTFNTNVPTTSVYPAVYFTATSGNGQNLIICDSGQFLSNNSDGDLYGLLMNPGNAPFGNTGLGTYSTTQNTINYNTGVANIDFGFTVPDGTPINAEFYMIQQGIPRSILFSNNIITVRPPPNIQYLIELDAYLTPAAFLQSTEAIPFGYMAEYIARGAARKILSDTGDIEQFQFYESLFKEQELLVWKRSQRQFTASRTQTIYSGSSMQSNYNSSGLGV